jgi:hypothetical protein
MSGAFKARKYYMVLNGAGKRQTALDVPLAAASLNFRHPMASPIVPSRVVTRDTKLDCTGEYIIGNEITSQLNRYTIAFDPTAQLLALWSAFAYGAAAAPTGSPANEVQTLTSDATGGTFSLTFAFEGKTETTDLLAYNITAANLKIALENLKSIRPGNVTVTGSLSAGFVITFVGKLASANVPLLTLNADSGTTLTGESSTTLVQTTPGAQRMHAISRTTQDQHPVTSLAFGFEGDAHDPSEHYMVTVDAIRIIGAAGRTGKVSCEVDVVSSADLSHILTAFSAPACVSADPIYTKDCRLEVNGSFINDILREFRFEYSNSVITGDDAFPFDDIDIQATEHGDRRSSLSFTVFGSNGDTVYELAEAETTVAVNLYVGVPGDRIKVIMPECNLALSDTPLQFIGDANKSAYVVNGTPYFSSTAGTPDKVEAYVSQSATFLST